MVKRTASALLWLIAVGWAFNFISAYTGVPQLIGTVVAVAVAGFVFVDPFGKIWNESAEAGTSSQTAERPDRRPSAPTPQMPAAL